MTGDQIRATLAEWNTTRREFADALALEGYRVEPQTVGQWKATVPAAVIRIVERWRDNPEQRPGKVIPNVTRKRMRNWR